MTPKQKMNKKYPTKGNKEYYRFVHDLDVYSKPIRQAERKEEQKRKWANQIVNFMQNSQDMKNLENELNAR